MKLYVKLIKIYKTIKKAASFSFISLFSCGKNKGFSLRQVLTAVSIITIHADM